MSSKAKRDIFCNINKPQDRVLYPFYASCVLIMLLFVGFAYLVIEHPLFENAMGYQAFLKSGSLARIKTTILGLGIMMAAVFLSLIYWAYYISNKVLGPYERIIEEMDRILEGKKTGELHVRKGDEMFTELLKRMNALIEKKQKVKVQEEQNFSLN